MWPIFHTFGTYEVGTYGVVFAVAMLIALWVARRLGVRDGLPPRDVNDVALGTLAGGFVGAVGLGLVVALITGAPIGMADFRNAGAIHGGLIGGMPAAYYLGRHFKLALPPLLDAYAPATAIGQAIGRLGCFAAGCCFGTPSEAAWAVTFSNKRALELGGVPLHVSLHPVQLYDAGAHLILFGVMFALHRRRKFVGSLFGVWCILEGLTRIAIETFRGDLGRGVWLDISWLSTGRLTALIMITLGAGFLFLMKKKQDAA